MRRTTLALSLVATLALTAGCDWKIPRPVPTPTSTATPTPAPTSAPTTTTSAPTTRPVPTTAPATTVPATTRPRPTTTRPAPTTTTSPSGSGTSAAERFNWGAPIAGDEFSGTALDTRKWGTYDGPGHAGNGRRDPAAFSVGGGLLTVSGDSSGRTGGMAWRDGQRYGRWEARMRVPAGDHQYHPVLILWPDAENFPEGGEVDYAETTTASDSVEFFLHYSAANRQTSASKPIGLTAWHNYAVDWSPSCIVGYIDGEQWFRDCNTAHLPPGAMHQTVQLDWFPSGGATKPSSMQLDWLRIYGR